MCDLLLEAAQLFDGEDLTTGGTAVAIAGGRIIASGPRRHMPPELISGAKQRLQFRGATMTLAPGLIDMHAHIDPTGGFPGDGSDRTTPRAGSISRYGVDPDQTYIPRGVTTVLSQGDAGISIQPTVAVPCVLFFASLVERCFRGTDVGGLQGSHH